MTKQTAWQLWVSDNSILMILVVVLLAGAVITLAKMFWNQYRNNEDSNINRLINSIDNLVKRIDELFEKHDFHEVRIGKLEKRIGEHFIRCNEREKLITDIKKRQDKGIEKLDKIGIPVGGHRQADCPIDRMDREN